MSKTILTFKPETDTKTGKGLRLYLKDGVIMNPAVDEAITVGIKEGLTAVAIRKSGSKRRSLVLEEAVTE